jgi:starch phosphorylase
MLETWEGLNRLARNFWWSWDAEATRLFSRLDPAVWSASGHNPVAVLDTLGPDGVQRRLRELEAQGNEAVDGLIARFQAETRRPPEWMAGGKPPRGPVAYFCAEFGVHESLHIYAGGLGILAGDHCKSASDLGVPMVAVGLLYREGYFTQLIDGNGRQRAYYRRADFERMALEPVCDELGRFQTLSIPSLEGDLNFCIWQTYIGRVRLILLDTNIWPNRASDRDLTLRLYGGSGDTRIRQEILLGVGGVRALRHLGVKPSVYHMNEGHTAFLTYELMREKVRAVGVDAAEAARSVREQCVLTTHTPVPAGHDRFAPEAVERHLGWMREELGLDSKTFLGYGRVNPNASDETFCMTVLALKNTRAANGVSELHGAVSRGMWHGLWPERPVEAVPIGHITNGVHIPTWMAPEMAALLDSQLGDVWRTRPWDPEAWAGVADIPDSLLWAVHLMLKQRLLSLAWRKEVSRRLRNAQRPRLDLDVFDPDVLTIGFARRFATYKRGDLLFRDLDRARRVLASSERPVRILFSGKAHPQDPGGADVLQRVVEATRDPVLSRHVFFLQNYGMDVARYLVQGVDVWLNTPRRPREASGTSGQKVPLNGGVNASTVDGWWCEAYDGHNGWNIGDQRDFHSDHDHDQADFEALYWVLEQRVLPMYYGRDPDGLPRQWIAIMKRSLATVAPRFNSHRMVREYAERMYWPAEVTE